MVRDNPINSDFLLEVVRRVPMLAVLQEGSMDRRDLDQRLEITKSTTHRNTKLLIEHGMVKRSSGKYALTEYGQAVADVVTTFRDDMNTVARLAPLFEAVSGTDPPCPIEAFTDATITSTEYGDPFGPVARFVSLIQETDSLRMTDSYAIAPTHIDEIHGRVLDGVETTVIEQSEVIEDIMKHYPDKCVQLCASDFIKIWIHDDLPFGLVILDHRIGIGVRAPETGVPRVFVDTEANEAREWAETIFESYWDEATELERFNPKALSETIEAMGQ